MRVLVNIIVQCSLQRELASLLILICMSASINSVNTQSPQFLGIKAGPSSDPERIEGIQINKTNRFTCIQSSPSFPKNTTGRFPDIGESEQQSGTLISRTTPAMSNEGQDHADLHISIESRNTVPNIQLAQYSTPEDTNLHPHHDDPDYNAAIVHVNTSSSNDNVPPALLRAGPSSITGTRPTKPACRFSFDDLANCNVCTQRLIKPMRKIDRHDPVIEQDIAPLVHDAICAFDSEEVGEDLISSLREAM